MVSFAEPEVRQQLRIEIQPIPQDGAISVQEKVYQPDLIEVIPAGAEEPILIKRRGDADFTRVKPGTSVKPHAKPHVLPSKQQAKFNNQSSSGQVGGADWKVTQPSSRRIANPLIDTSRGEYLGYLLGGALDELIDRPRELRERELPFQDPVNQAFYDFGRGITNWAEEQLNNIWDLFNDSINNIPDFEIPSFDLPKFSFPEFELPQLELPKLNLPELELPSIEFLDLEFDPFNAFEDRYQRQKEDLIEREKAKETQPDSPTTKEQLDRLFRLIPETCYAQIQFIRYRFRYYPNGYSVFSGNYTVTPWQPGRGDAKPIGKLKDLYGNSLLVYLHSTEGSGAANQVGFFNAFSGFTTEDVYGKNLLIEYQTSMGNVIRDSSTEIIANYFSNWAFDSIRVICFASPQTYPRLPGPYDDRPPIPPNPPKKMNCCSCDDIAQILKKTLQTLKYQVTIPVVSCELEDDTWTPKVSYKQIEIFAVDYNTAVAQAEVYRELAIQSKIACETKNLIERAAKTIGVDDYPVKLPKSLITKSEGFPGNLISDGEVEAPSLTQFLAWYVERFDEIMGQWEIPIEIKDSDPSTPGDQPKGIKLPNMAEAIAEMFTLSYQSYLNSELMLNLSTRHLIETGQDKRQNFITYKLLLSLTDYIGYKYKEVKADMPLMFTPEKVSFDELLKETKVKVAVPEFDEKLNFQTNLMRYNKAASILDSVFFRRVDPNGDIKAQLMKTLFDLLKSANDFNEATDDNFDQFIDDAEIGFTNTPGITDTVNPYGRSYSQRPRIRDLSKPEDQDSTP